VGFVDRWADRLAERALGGPYPVIGSVDHESSPAAVQETIAARTRGGFKQWPRQLFTIIASIALIDDAREFKSNLFDWLDRWKSIVERANEFLFGWVDFWWIRLSNAEAHALTLILIFIASSQRGADRIDEREEEDSGDKLWYAMGKVVQMLFFLVPATIFGLALPSVVGLFGIILVLAHLLLFGFWFRWGEDGNRAAWLEIRRSLTVVAGLILLDAAIEGW